MVDWKYSINDLSFVQSFKSMYFFLCTFENRPQHEDLSSFLGDLLFVDRGDIASTSDPASWYDWIESVHKTVLEESHLKTGLLTHFQAFQVMCSFVTEYQKRTNSRELGKLLKEFMPIANDSEGSVDDKLLWKRWQESIQKGIRAKSPAD